MLQFEPRRIEQKRHFGLQMNGPHLRLIAVFTLLLGVRITRAQSAPISPDHPWNGATGMRSSPPRPAPNLAPNPLKPYTLAELIDLAEQHNPETRVAWENAKARAADLGIAKASLYPTLAAAALAQSVRDNILFAPFFYRRLHHIRFRQTLAGGGCQSKQSCGSELSLQRHPPQDHLPGHGGILSIAQ
jgi:hypothetical protein